MKVLITGASGLLGKEVSKLYPDALTPKHSELNIINESDIFEYFRVHKINLVIHLAALTTIKKNEENKELGWKTNVKGTENLLIALHRTNSSGGFVYMSTPCVFSGDDGPYNEKSIPYPKSFYGFTKYVGGLKTKISSRFGSKSMVIISNFVGYAKWPHEKAFTDRYSNYLFAHDLAKAIKETIEFKEWSEVFHIVGKKRLSMFELAKMCPDSENVQPYTLEEFYKDNPNSGKLTQNMSLETINHPKKYDITIPEGVEA